MTVALNHSAPGIPGHNTLTILPTVAPIISLIVPVYNGGFFW
jgi:hypothetical protein